MRPLLVGEANPYSDDPRHALLPWPPNSAGDRLMRILGLDEKQYLAMFDRANLVTGRRWNSVVARASARRLLAERGGVLVLLGRRVAAAFGVDMPYFSSTTRFRMLPHPSGLCRVWNDFESAYRARALLSDVIGGA